MHCICINHCIIIHLHLECFCSANCIYFISIVRMLCSLIHDPCSFLYKKKKTKQKKEGKNIWLTVFQIKKYRHSCDLILSFLKVVFWEKSEWSRTAVVQLNLSIENPLNVLVHENSFLRICTVSFIFPCYKVMTKTTIDTTKPYIGTVRGNMHKPQANLGANQKFSPGRLKTRKGDLSKN